MLGTVIVFVLLSLMKILQNSLWVDFN